MQQKKSNILKIAILFFVLAGLIAGLVLVIRNDFSFIPGKPGVVLPGDKPGDGNEKPGDEDKEDEDKPGDGNEKPGDKDDEDKEDEKPGENDKKHITGVKLISKDFIHDGLEKRLELTGTLPEGVSVKWFNNSAISVGIHNVEALLTGDDYITLELNANLTIAKKQDDNNEHPEETPKKHFDATLTSKTFIYDGLPKSLELEGNITTGVDIVWKNNTQTEVGDYIVELTLSAEGYITKTLSANLHIVEEQQEKEEPVKITGVSLDSKDFVYDGTEKSLKLNGELPEGVTAVITNNARTEVGTTIVKAVLTGDGYITLELNANLRILPIEEEDEELYKLTVRGLGLDGHFRDIKVIKASEFETITIEVQEIIDSVNNYLHSHNPYITATELELHDDIMFSKKLDNVSFFMNRDRTIYAQYKTSKTTPIKYHTITFKPILDRTFTDISFSFGDRQTLIGYEDLDSLISNHISNEFGIVIDNLIYYKDSNATEIYNKSTPIIFDQIIFIDFDVDEESTVDDNIYLTMEGMHYFIGQEELPELDTATLNKLNWQLRSASNSTSIFYKYELYEGMRISELINIHHYRIRTMYENILRAYGVYDSDRFLLDDWSLYENKTFYQQYSNDYQLNSQPAWSETRNIGKSNSLGPPEGVYSNDSTIGFYFNNYFENIYAASRKMIIKVQDYKHTKVYDIKTNPYNIQFADAEYEYDGTYKSINVEGNFPEGTKIQYPYTHNEQVDADKYWVTAKISIPEYREIILEAQLYIYNSGGSGQGKDYDIWSNPYNIKFESKDFVYDGKVKSLEVYGEFPEKTIIDYENNHQVEENEWNVYVYIRMPDYNVLILNATLTIYTDYTADDYDVEVVNQILNVGQQGNIRNNELKSLFESLEQQLNDKNISFSEISNSYKNNYKSVIDKNNNDFEGFTRNLIDTISFLDNQKPYKNHSWAFNNLSASFMHMTSDLYTLFDKEDKDEILRKLDEFINVGLPGLENDTNEILSYYHNLGF